MELKSVKKIFFYRICGTGMGAAALLLKEKGYEVCGYDQTFYPPMGDYLKKSDIELFDTKSFKLSDFDLIIVGNVIGKDSEDAKIIKESGTPFTSFPTALGKLILKDQNVVGVAGTHGKTTTTYLLAQIFKNLGFDPGYFIGGVLEHGPSSYLGDGSYFFIEADEYDSSYFEKFSKFRSYELDHMILTSLEFDHGDIFNNIEEIKDQFKAVIPRLKTVVANTEFKAVRDLKQKDWIDLKYSKMKDSSEFEINGEIYKTNLIGEHNLLNLTGAILFALNEGIETEKIKKAITNLQLVKRRQEVRGFYKDTMVIDDFAHHPRAVKMTYDAMMSKYPGKEIIVVLEPASSTARSNVFQEEFKEAISTISQVILAKPLRDTTVLGGQNLDFKRLAQDHKNATVVEDLPTLVHTLEKLTGGNSLFLILSNGTCLGLWESDFVKHLKSGM